MWSDSVIINKDLSEGGMNLSLTDLSISVERFDMHDVADAPADNHHLPSVCFTDPHDSSQSPVGEVDVT